MGCIVWCARAQYNVEESAHDVLAGIKAVRTTVVTPETCDEWPPAPRGFLWVTPSGSYPGQDTRQIVLNVEQISAIIPA